MISRKEVVKEDLRVHSYIQDILPSLHCLMNQAIHAPHQLDVEVAVAMEGVMLVIVNQLLHIGHIRNPSHRRELNPSHRRELKGVDAEMHKMQLRMNHLMKI